MIVCATTDSQRAAEWRRAYGRERLPVTTAQPELALVLGQIAPVLWLDFGQLDTDERESLVRYLAERFEVSLAEAWVRIDQEGVPILWTDDLIVVEMLP